MTESAATTDQISAQIERLIDLGVPTLAGISDEEFRALGASLSLGEGADAYEGRFAVVVHPDLVAAGALAPLLRRGDKPGFVVQDMTDLEEFVPIEGLEVPAGPLYLVRDPQRGADLLSWSPAEALPEITGRGRRAMTISEGISWLLQAPDELVRGECFMTIGLRKRKAKGLDARTPAIWISNGTGRDGRERRDAPKVGWCWANNRHRWLGFGSVAV